MPDALDLLQKIFGYTSFRGNQEAVIANILEKKDTLVLMPTGGGKSLCYQLPALMLEGLTVVISPLIALMKDQVDALRLNGVAAAYLNSTLSGSDQQRIRKELSEDALKLLYLAPEHLLKTENEFIAFLKNLRIALIAIDEAHCISHWGHDFRPEYRMLSRLKKEFPDVPVIALTATADSLTRKDILEKLALKSPLTFISSFNRPNIRYSVEPKRRNFERLLEFLETRRNDSGIIYCLSRASTESLAAQLQMYGFKALAYHAGLERDTRNQHQEWFLKDDVKIMTATIAFGMGIDKSNVRFVVHMDLPKSIESYYQETGRAGRDGLDSEALLFYGYGDVAKLKGFAEVEGNPEQTLINLQKLEKMARFGDLKSCRRKYLLNYFDESAPEQCGNCDICLTKFEYFDGTIVAQKALSAVTRLKERFGVTYVADFLRGADKIRPEHRELRTFGTGSDISKEAWMRFINELVGQGYLKKSEGQYPLLQLTAKSGAVLAGGEIVRLIKSTETTSRAEQIELPHEAALMEELKSLRWQLAQSENVPAYVVLSDATLLELSTYLPLTMEDLSKISGFGEIKLKRYGEQFIEAVAGYCRSNGLDSRINQRKPKRQRLPRREIETETKTQTLELFQLGHSIRKIADIRNLSASTIENHLAYYITEGKIAIEQLLHPQKQAQIESAIKVVREPGLAPIKQMLGDEFSYGEIRMVIAHRDFVKSQSSAINPA